MAAMPLFWIVTVCAAAAWPHDTVLKSSGLGPMLMGAIVPVPLKDTDVAVDAQRAPVTSMAAMPLFAPELAGVNVALAPDRLAPGAIDPAPLTANSASLGVPKATVTASLPTFLSV